MVVKEVVTIFPARVGQTTKLICRTRIGNQWFVLTKNWKILTDEQFGKGKYANEEIMEISFSRQRSTYSFAFDLHPERENPAGDDVEDMKWTIERALETDKHNAAFNFFAKHMQVNPIGMTNPNLLGEPMFKMVFVNHQTVNECIKSDKKVQVYNKVSAMNLQDKLNLALYFMPSLYGKRHSEIKNALINLESGLLLTDAYLDEVIAYDPFNTTVAMRTYVNKAIQMGILTSGANGYYMQGNVYVGADEMAIMGYYLKDPASYNNVIVPAVNKMVKLPEDDLVFLHEDLTERLRVTQDFEKNKGDGVNRELWLTKLTQTQEEAKMLGIKNVMQKTYTSLAHEIDSVKRGDHKHLKQSKQPSADPQSVMGALRTEAKQLGVKGYAIIKSADKLKEMIKVAKAQAEEAEQAQAS